MELQATKTHIRKNAFGEDGDAWVHPAVVNGSDSDYPEESAEEVNEASTRPRGVAVGEVNEASTRPRGVVVGEVNEASTRPRGVAVGEVNEASTRPRGVAVGEKRVENAEEVNETSTRGVWLWEKNG